MTIISDELKAVRDEFATPRRTEIVDYDGDLDDEDLIEREDMVVTVTHGGYIKRTSLAEFVNIRNSGLIAATVGDDDALVDAKLTNGRCDIIMASRDGQAIRFDEADVRPMGRTARGVRGMGLRKGDQVVNILVLDREQEQEIGLLTVCEKGYGKRTPASEYRSQSRSGLGLRTIKTSSRNGKVVGVIKVRESDQLMVVTSEGKIIRTPVSGISELGRATQGVRLIRLGDDEVVVGLARVDDEGDELPGEVVELPPDDPDLEDEDDEDGEEGEEPEQDEEDEA
jgi:DNA gyrase subunit A